MGKELYKWIWLGRNAKSVLFLVPSLWTQQGEAKGLL